MECKSDLIFFLKHIDKINFKEKQIVLISGQDMSAGDAVFKHIQKRLKKEINHYECLTFSQDKDEAIHLQEELQNAPLFQSYRLLVVRESKSIFSELLSSPIQKKNTEASVDSLSDSTLLLLLYDGSPTKSFLSLWKDQKNFSHLITTKLYAHQIGTNLQNALVQRGLKLSVEAFQLLSESIDSKTGNIQKILDQLEIGLYAKKKEITIEQVRSALNPSQGWDVFALVDALFSGNLSVIVREYKLFHPSTDNFFSLLKIILKHINEIRLAKIAYEQKIGEKELIAMLGLGSRHPFVQKKILMRLRNEVPRFTNEKQLAVYNFLISMQKAFLSQTPLRYQSLLFQTESLRIFSDE